MKRTIIALSIILITFFLLACDSLSTQDQVEIAAEEIQLSTCYSERYGVEIILPENNDLELPTIGEYNTNITWKSNTPSLIEDDGTIHHIGAFGFGGLPCIKATVSKGNHSIERTFCFRFRDSCD